jgi:hypothetical protein
MSNGAKKHESEMNESRRATDKVTDPEYAIGEHPARSGSAKGRKLHIEEPLRQEALRDHTGKATTSRWKGNRVDND